MSFEIATKVFKDPFAVDRLDVREDYGEERYILIGTADGVVLTVVYTERTGRIRIISTRRRSKIRFEVYRARFFGHKFDLSDVLHVGLLPGKTGFARAA